MLPDTFDCDAALLMERKHIAEEETMELIFGQGDQLHPNRWELIFDQGDQLHPTLDPDPLFGRIVKNLKFPELTHQCLGMLVRALSPCID